MCRCLANTCLLWVMAWLTVGCWIFPALFNQFACWNSCLGVRSSQISISKAFNKKTGKIRKACIQFSGFWGSHVRLANAAVLVFFADFFLHLCIAATEFIKCSSKAERSKCNTEAGLWIWKTSRYTREVYIIQQNIALDQSCLED